MAAIQPALALAPGSKQGLRAVTTDDARKFFDRWRYAPRRNTVEFQDLTDRRNFDWVSWIFTAWSEQADQIVGEGIVSARIAFNQAVHDPNRVVLLRLELILVRVDGSRVRLYPGATVVIFETPMRARAFPLDGPANPRAITWTLEEIQATPQVYAIGKKIAHEFLIRADALFHDWARWRTGSTGYDGRRYCVVWDLTDGRAWQWWRFVRTLTDARADKMVWPAPGIDIAGFAIMALNAAYQRALDPEVLLPGISWLACFALIQRDPDGGQRVLMLMRHHSSRGWRYMRPRDAGLAAATLMVVDADSV